MPNEEIIQLVVRLLTHRDYFKREQWLELQGWKVKQGKMVIDGYEDPGTGEMMDLETAFITAQTRDVMQVLRQQEEKRLEGMG